MRLPRLCRCRRYAPGQMLSTGGVIEVMVAAAVYTFTEQRNRHMGPGGQEPSYELLACSSPD